jgi:hypothetical protein
MPKKLLNLYEEATRRHLRTACEKWGATVFSKVRLADVLEIEGSGISSEDFRFALQSHFDFVVADSSHTPLFAVEFDGPIHEEAPQKSRDLQKNRLCGRLEFPLLRINARYLVKKYRRFDLLSWFVDVWFLHRGFYKAQEAGSVPPDELFDPADVVALEGYSENFPLWFSRDGLLQLQTLSLSGRCLDPVPSHYIGFDENDAYRGIAHLRIDQKGGVVVKTGMRAQFFPGVDSEIVHQLLIQELYEALIRVLNGKNQATPLEEIDRQVREYEDKFKLASTGGYSRLQLVQEGAI